MERQIVGCERRQAADRPGYGVGDVMQLDVEEYWHAERRNCANAVRTLSVKEFEAEFETIHLAADSLRESQRYLEIRIIESAEDPRPFVRCVRHTPRLFSAVMTYNASQITARALLNAGAFLIRSQAPFRLTSGLIAPFYINCRLILGHAEARSAIADALAAEVAKWDAEMIAGGVTAGVPFATLVADRLGLPLVYVRPQPKSHGTGGQIEGGEVKGRKIVLVEDLITSATSIVHFTNALRGAGAVVEHASLVFARMTEAAQPALDQIGMTISVLCDMDTLLALAEEEGIADAAAITEVRAYLADAEGWSLAHSMPGSKD